MTKGRKDFDAVETMRSIRAKISAEIEHMTLEEELAWLSRELDDPFLEEPYFNGRNTVLQVQHGPFLAVTPEVGDCLNVRLEPSPDATVIDCFVAGVLLRDLDESQPGDGQVVQTWRRVRTPAGDDGWASDEFLAP